MNKASKVSFTILKSLKSKDPKFLINMFNTYARPILEFASPVWNPYTKSNKIILERVQKRFLRSIYLRTQNHNNIIPNYEELLTRFQINSLEVRRLKIDLKLFHNIIWGHVSLQHNNAFSIRHSRTRGDQYKFFTSHCSSMVRYHSYFIRTTRLYAKLPIEIRKNNPSMFAKLLDNFDLAQIDHNLPSH